MRLEPADEATLEAFTDAFKMVEEAMGFVPNSMKAMANSPPLLRGFMALSFTVLGPDSDLDAGLRQMIAHVSSAAAGCRYCQAHTAHSGEKRGVAPEKLEALWSYETSELFSEAERAALALAQAGGSVPNQARDDHFEALKLHYSRKQIAEIMGVISLFGFLNRWNDTLATPLEDSPLGFAEAHLAQNGWEIGDHG